VLPLASAAPACEHHCGEHDQHCPCRSREHLDLLVATTSSGVTLTDCVRVLNRTRRRGSAPQIARLAIGVPARWALSGLVRDRYRDQSVWPGEFVLSCPRPGQAISSLGGTVGRAGLSRPRFRRCRQGLWGHGGRRRRHRRPRTRSSSPSPTRGRSYASAVAARLRNVRTMSFLAARRTARSESSKAA